MKGCLSETRWGGHEGDGKGRAGGGEGQKSLSSLRGKLELYSLLSIFEHLSLHLDGILLLLLLIFPPPLSSPLAPSASPLIVRPSFRVYRVSHPPGHKLFEEISRGFAP